MICLYRIDDRLIHGQVQTNWIQICHAKNILVIDDKVSNDEISCQILRFATPENMKLKILNVEEAVKFWEKAVNSKNNILVLSKTIVTCQKLVEKGIKLNEIMIGPVSCKDNAKEIVRGSYFSEEEIQAANYLQAKGVSIVFQQTPDEKRIYWKDIHRR